jgi:hypothetical protein
MSGTISATTAALIAAAVGAAGVGTGVFESVKSGDENSANQAAQKAQLAQEQQSAATQANLTKQEAVLGAQGQAQQQTGGSLTDPGTTALTDLLAGYPGYQGGSSSGTGGTNPSTAIAPTTLSGAQPGASGGGSGGGLDIAAILAALRGGSGGSGSGTNISGGNWQTSPAAPQSTFQLANPPL